MEPQERMTHELALPKRLFELALFAGAGGGILAGKILGWRCIGVVESEEYRRGILAQR